MVVIYAPTSSYACSTLTNAEIEEYITDDCNATIEKYFDLDGAEHTDSYLDEDCIIDEIYVKLPYSLIDTVSGRYRVGCSLNEETLNNFFDGLVGAGNRLAEPTYRYNCHSYAWYSTDIDNNHIWIDDPSEFYDGVNDIYIEVEGEPQAGDIICYFKNGTDPNSNSDDENIHSGIVKCVLPTTEGGIGGDVIVISKWGEGGLYIHNGYRCPYTWHAYGLYFSDSPGSQEAAFADYVKYYRHTHNYNYMHEDYGDTNNHIAYCACGDFVYENHAYNDHYVDNGNTSTHLAYCACGNYIYANHIYEPPYINNENANNHIKYCICSDFIYENHAYNDLYVDNEDLITHDAYCSCGIYIVQNHNWVLSTVDPASQYEPNYIPQEECSQCHALKLHLHNYTNSYLDYGHATYHKAYCTCGEFINQDHTWVIDSLTASTLGEPNAVPQYRCTKCGALTSSHMTHSYTDHYVDNGDLETHKAYCSCGLYVNQSHTWSRSIMNDEDQAEPNALPRYTCTKCGAITIGPIN